MSTPPEGVVVCYACLKKVAPGTPKAETVPECSDYRHKGRYHPACAASLDTCLYCRHDVLQRGEQGTIHLLAEFAGAHKTEQALMYRYLIEVARLAKENPARVPTLQVRDHGRRLLMNIQNVRDMSATIAVRRLMSDAEAWTSGEPMTRLCLTLSHPPPSLIPVRRLVAR
jgi:hypothetical protein